MSQAEREHVPVLLEPLLKYVAPSPGEIVLDATVGLAGHALPLLERIRPGGRLIGLDLDPQILEIARGRLAPPADARVDLVHANYADFPAVLADLGIPAVDIIVADIGVNSAQLAAPERGFSFDRDGPLDMRYDTSTGQRALDIVNRWDERELADLFYEYGQEHLSRKIAKRICQVRHETRITTTMQLARAVESALTSAGAGGGKTHPATKVFQALRIAVNHELENLERFLGRAPEYLRSGGRLAIIDFHSLEDGIVKRMFRAAQAAGQLEDLTPRPVIADAAERMANRRSRSAKLRVARRTSA